MQGPGDATGTAIAFGFWPDEFAGETPMPLTAEQRQEISNHRKEIGQTRRPISSGLESIMLSAIPVLDHGFVRVVDYMGDDSAIVQAARVSYGKGTRQARNDEGLIRYLMRHRHTTPFEMCELKLHVKLPIFVARQWIRHRMASVNEYSARYSILDREFYFPQPEQIAAQSTDNHQGRGDRLSESEAEDILSNMARNAEQAYGIYQDMLASADSPGVARELARINLPANIYTQWYWKADLHNLLNFVALRADAHAQWEIRQYAQAVSGIIKDWVPATYRAFEDYNVNAVQLSAAAARCVRAMIGGEKSISNPRACRSVNGGSSGILLTESRARELQTRQVTGRICRNSIGQAKIGRISAARRMDRTLRPEQRNFQRMIVS